MPAISAVVFDIGGVLLDWDPEHLYRQLIDDPADRADFLGSICTPRWHRTHDLGAGIRQSCAELAARHPEHASLIMAWAQRGEEMIAGVFDEVVAVLADIKAAGLRCFALSNMEAETYALRRVRYDFFRLFDGCVISGVEGVAKPDRRIFEILLSRYGLEPGATVFVDDHAANVAAARELGVVGIEFVNASELRRDLAGLGVPAGDGREACRPAALGIPAHRKADRQAVPLPAATDRA